MAAPTAPSASSVRALAAAQQTVQPSGVVTPYRVPIFDGAGAYLSWAFDVRMSLLVVEFLGRVSLVFEGERGKAVVSAVDNGTAATSSVIFTLPAPTADAIDHGATGSRSTQDKYPADSTYVDALVAQNEGIDAFMLRSVGASTELHGAKYESARAVSILVNLVCLRLKHAFAVQRPSELDSGIVPMLPVPGHANFPGGHATMASALPHVIAATVKWHRLRQARRAGAADRVEPGSGRAALRTGFNRRPRFGQCTGRLSRAHIASRRQAAAGRNSRTAAAGCRVGQGKRGITSQLRCCNA